MSIRLALIAMGYTEVKPDYWCKPIAFQMFSYAHDEWQCWFKPADGGKPSLMERKKFADEQISGSYLRQLKEFEQWSKKDVYTTDSHFELMAIDL